LVRDFPATGDDSDVHDQSAIDNILFETDSDSDFSSLPQSWRRRRRSFERGRPSGDGEPTRIKQPFDEERFWEPHLRERPEWLREEYERSRYDPERMHRYPQIYPLVHRPLDPWKTYPSRINPVIHRAAHLPPTPHEDSLAQVLALSNGHFVWMKQNKHYLSYLVHDEECVRYHFIPHPHVEAQLKTSTIVSKQWVMKEVLALFKYDFKEHLDAFYAINRDLAFVSVPPGT
jgi:hypothetical protein